MVSLPRPPALPTVRPRTGLLVSALRAALAGLCIVGANAAQAQAAQLAQLGLPPANLPALPSPWPGWPARPLQDTLNAAVPLDEARQTAERQLLRRHRDLVEPDPAGHPVRRAELLWLAPAPAALQAAQAQGFVLLREFDLPELGLHQWVMRPPAGVDLAEAAQRLRAFDPEAGVDFNHLYQPGGAVASEAVSPPVTPAAAVQPNGTSAHAVGLIDGGLDRRHPALAGSTLHTWGCDGREVPSAHGTGVASLLIGQDGAFQGAAPVATLYAADVYCGQPAGGAVVDVVRALAWLVREHVPVINVSLVGPPNLLLDKAVRAVMRSGHLLVAAVGNDGPTAPPLYPAAYAGVVGVTGVTPARRALPEAAQGPQVSVSAPGAGLAVARAGGGYGVARGTSFAAPIVAGLLATYLMQPDGPAAGAALGALCRQAIDLGEPGRDPVYGCGLVGEATRVAPERVGARQP